MSISTISAVFILVVFLNVLYWNVVHPLLLRSVLFRIFEKRDALRFMAINGEIEVSSSEYKYLQDFLCKTVAWIPRVSIVEFAIFVAKQKHQTPANLDQFHKSASKELKEMRHAVIHDAFRIMLINSPLLSSVMLVAVYASWMMDKLPLGKLFQRTEQFVNTFEHDRYQPA